jgi:hypothetical protein
MRCITGCVTIWFPNCRRFKGKTKKGRKGSEAKFPNTDLRDILSNLFSSFCFSVSNLVVTGKAIETEIKLDISSSALC